MTEGFYDSVGIYHYGEDDLASPVSDLLNLLADSTSLTTQALKDSLQNVIQMLQDRNVWHTGNAAAAFSGWILGTGGTAEHRWRILDGIFEVHFTVVFGGPGWNLQQPEGKYLLPAGWKQASIGAGIVGAGILEDVSNVATGRWQVLTPLSSPDANFILLRHSAGTGQTQQPISNTTPFTWAPGDKVSGYIRVPVMPA